MIHILDLQFLGINHAIAAFLLQEGQDHVLIESGPYSTHDHLRSRLKEQQVKQIQHVVLSHIHLDHAGAAWAFAKEGAKIYLQEKGYRHMHNPDKLLASAKMIYQDQMDTLWGHMEGIPEDRLKVVSHEEQIKVGAIELTALYTPGHAVHHLAWEYEDVIFTGDVAGVKIEGGPVVPPCPPPDINIEDWIESIQLIRHRKPRKLMLTHFGEITAIDEHLEHLEQTLWDWAAWMRPYYEANKDQKEVVPLFQQYVSRQLEEHGVNPEGIRKYEAANPSWMSVAGLYRYWKKKLE
jgi:glyoxylase-like metal-dependent hydrolase (beta-lactamase superfamily II)